MLGLIAMPKASIRECAKCAWGLSLSNCGSWVDLCTDENGDLVLAVGAQSWELRKSGLNRITTWYEGEVV